MECVILVILIVDMIFTNKNIIKSIYNENLTVNFHLNILIFL